HSAIQILGDGGLVSGLERDLAQNILVVGIEPDSGIVDLPLSIAADGTAADDSIVARLIERVAVVGVKVQVDGCDGVGERLRLLAALTIHPRKVAESEGSGLRIRLIYGGRRLSGCGDDWRSGGRLRFHQTSNRRVRPRCGR